ncbi:hypothetical protein OnM2_099042 [Erysiphe neolycopersici]|uniref:DRBM domain-containing protein n=1 Tax=Erysiphe neolycopersici TaxID=212602 RepID=A0A420HA12_9PEZI|nr:hypothetical protein OnM2_099042 [Erysiphe neolycopersici]
MAEETTNLPMVGETIDLTPVAENYQTLLNSLCRNRGWSDPEYAISFKKPFYSSTVRVFNQSFTGDQCKVSDEAKETAARRAYNSLNNLPADQNKRNCLTRIFYYFFNMFTAEGNQYQ